MTRRFCSQGGTLPAAYMVATRQPKTREPSALVQINLETLRRKRARYQPAQTKFVKRNDGGQVVLPELVVNHAKSRHYNV